MTTASRVAVVAAVVAAGCALPRGEVRGSGASPLRACTTAWSEDVALVKCRFAAMVPARYSAWTRLAELVQRQVVTEAELRATAEHRSLMDAGNVWQWSDRVTDAEALAMCRSMLADMRAGRSVDWDRDARGHLALVRGGGAVPGARMGAVSGSRTVEGERGSGRAHRSGSAHVPVRERLDRGWLVLDGGKPGSDVGEQLARVLALAEAEAAALAVIFAGAAGVVIAIEIGGATVTYELTFAGATGVLDRELATRLGDPLLADMARQMREIEALSGEVGDSAWRLELEQRLVYRELVHRPVAELGQRELEHIQWLREAGGIADVPAPGTPAHKAEAWAAYRASGRDWAFERWSPNYDRNIIRAREARGVADAHWRKLGWGEREVRVRVDPAANEWRVLDIADPKRQRAVEVKSGYVTYDAEVARQVRRDAKLVAADWTITWHIEGRCSTPLREALHNVGIVLEETHPDTPIEELRRLRREQLGQE